ncbi:YwqJ-related putative deaminase [Pseudomonas khavaziana]|uniref:YwqJ-related putative deaminase n=1 Tax=Pseudomonas khavaziana TaxID=2842351 RepID=UPI003BAE1C56
MNVTVDALIRVANAEKSKGRVSGAASELNVRNRRFFGVSSFKHSVHQVVQAALSRVPSGSREPWHGWCAEVSCLSQSFDVFVDPDGGTIRTVNIGESGKGHGKPKKTCRSCDVVLKDLGVNHA